LDLAFYGLDRHSADPVLVIPVFVLDSQADRAAHGLAKAHSAVDLREVGFDLLTLAPAVALLTAAQVGGDVLLRHRQVRRHAFNDDQQALAVRLAGGEETKVPQSDLLLGLRPYLR